MADPALAEGFGGREAGALLPAQVMGPDTDGLTRLQTAAGPVWLAQALPPGQWSVPEQAEADAAAWHALRDAIAAEPVPVFPLAGRDARRDAAAGLQLKRPEQGQGQ